MRDARCLIIVALVVAAAAGFVIGAPWIAEKVREPDTTEKMLERTSHLTPRVERVDGASRDPLQLQYDLAVLAYNRAEYGGDPRNNPAATNYTVGHARAEEMLLDYLMVAGAGREGMAPLLVGELRRRRGDHCGAIRWYEDAFTNERTAYVALHAGVNLAYACLRCGETARAREVVAEMQRTPGIESESNVLACAAIVQVRSGHDAYNRGKWGAAEGYYRKARELKPGWPEATAMLAFTYCRLAEGAEEEGAGKVAFDYLARADMLVNSPEAARYTRGTMGRARDHVRERIGRR